LKMLSGAQRYSFADRRRLGSSRPAGRLILFFAVLISGLASLAWPAWGQSHEASGYEVKTAFLFNFAKFIDWPSSSFATPQSSFTICVLGVDPFGNVLDEALQGKVIGDRPLALRRLKDKAEARRCQIVFVSSSESAHLADILASLQGANVLLVGDTYSFAASGGTIEFTLEDNHVRFSINTDAVNRSGLRFSSKLLALAKIVRDQVPPKGE
jgi:hypothetical protein